MKVSLIEADSISGEQFLSLTLDADDVDDLIEEKVLLLIAGDFPLTTASGVKAGGIIIRIGTGLGTRLRMIRGGKADAAPEPTP